ncbi:MAG TPA: Sir2 family NAD-dependent protein deacetylase [Candidatus Dormibacteraeota bacterium]|jgi:NAD-dependent deacetylase
MGEASLRTEPTGLERAARLIAAARRGVAFTGAGISQESGIQTYRGEGGLWNTTNPATSSIDFFVNDPGAYWRVARERGERLLAARPNAAHEAIVELERRGNLLAVVTQNVDGLHLLAGSKDVIELHGNGREVVCLDCGNREPRSHVQARLEEELPPRCPRCGGIHLKPAAVFFGEAMPAEATGHAFRLAEECDLMLVVGSSLVVYPAAQVPLVAHDAGAPLVILNAEPTPFDKLATVILRGRAGDLLPELVALSGQLKR